MKRYTAAGTAVGACLSAAAATAASVEFTRRVLSVTVNDGGVFAPAAAGDRFGARFDYPNSAGPSMIDEADEANYPLSGTALLWRGGSAVSATAIDVSIQNDRALDRDEADFINTLLAPDPPVASDTRVDTFTLAALQQGAFAAGPDPGDGDDEERLFNGVGFEFALLAADAALYDSLVFRPFPPPFAQTRVRAFTVREADATGGLIFEAFDVIERLDVAETFHGTFEVPAP